MGKWLKFLKPGQLESGNVYDNVIVLDVGLVGIGTSSPSFNLEVNGSAAKPGGGSWSVSSHKHFKNNIRDYDAGLADILRIRPVQLIYNELSGYDIVKEHVGVIAQEFQEISPSMVGTYEKDVEEYLNVDNSAMTYMLINAV